MKGLNTFSLKWIAIISMLLDHIGAVLFPWCEWLRIIGRLAFPIFAYLLVEGFFYTKDLKKYLIRLGIFALISEIPFDLAFFGCVFELSHQNVFFELLVGMLMLYFMVKSPGKLQQAIIMIVTMLVSDWLCMDYGSWGILMILTFYLCRDKNVIKASLIVLLNIMMWQSGYLTQQFAGLAMIPIIFHNRQLGPKMKMFFYTFYPAHLLILFLISMIMYR